MPLDKSEGSCANKIEDLGGEMAKRHYFEEGKIVGNRGIRGWGLCFGVSASVF